MALVDKDLKTPNMNTFKVLKGNTSLMRRRIKDFKKWDF